MGFTFSGDGDVIIRLSSNGLLTHVHAKHDVEQAPIIILPEPEPEPVDEVEPSILAPDKLCSLTAADQADTMSTGDEEQSLGLNGRLRPRKSLVASPLTTKVSRKSDGKSPSGRPKRNTSTSNAPPCKLDDLANKSDSFLTPQILCPYCDKKFASKQNVIKHVRRLHMFGTKHEATINCLFCNHAEPDFEIIRHMVDSHPNQYFACLDCHSRFNSTAELANHKLGVCERQKPNYNTKPRQKNGSKKNRNSLRIGANEDFRDDSQEYSTGHGFNGIVISCELKPSQVSDDADIEDNITTNLILPHTKSLGANTGIEKNAVIVLDDLQWNKRIPPNFSFQNTDADQILSRLGVVHRSPRTADASRRDWYKLDEAMQKFEKCFDTSFYSKVASNVQENLTKFLDGSFNFNPDPDSMIKTRKSKNSVVINTAEGFPILLAREQFSRNVFDGYMPRAIAPKHKWKWENQENDRSAMNPDQIKRDAHTNNCIITLISSLDIWTQLSMRKKFEDKFNISPPEKKTEKQLTLGKELKEILESRELPAVSSQIVQFKNKPLTNLDTNDFPASLGLKRAEKPIELKPAVLSGESVRPRCYVCCACGAQEPDSKSLSSHITTQHPNAQVQHYEVVGELLLNADIFKHLYVPPSQIVNRTRPLRGIRDCTKCKKPITLEDLHQHILECAGDTPTVRRKCRHHRPFGVRRRRPRLPDNTIRKKMRKDIRTRQIRPKTRIRSRPKIRSEVGDAETIRKMLADLPAKRHRSTANPNNLMLRPSKRNNIQRNKFLIKRRSSEEQRSRRLRSSRQAGSAHLPSTSASIDKDLDPDDEDNKPLKPKAITNKIIFNEPVKRNTKINRVKRKSLRTKEKSSSNIVTLSDAPTTASDKPTESLSPVQSPQKVNVNNAPYNTREHGNRGGSNSRDNQRAGGSRRNDNPDNAAPAPNLPLKHSIARLTADSEKHDKSVQFHHLFLVQQEYNHVNSTVQHGHTHQPVFFENEAVVTKLDKPPLPDVLKNISDWQKCKSNKPRKGLNDCIAMLKNKLVDPIPSATHVSVLCGNDDPIDEYVNEQIAPIMSSPLYDQHNGIIQSTGKNVEPNFTKPLDPPTVPSPVALSPALPPKGKSLRNERSLRYHRKALPEREVIPKPKRLSRRNTYSETNMEKQKTPEAILPIPKNVLPKAKITAELPRVASLDIKLPRDSSLDIIPLPVQVTRNKQSSPLNIESENVKKNKTNRNEEQNNVVNDFPTIVSSKHQRDLTQVNSGDRVSEVTSKPLQNMTSFILSKRSDDLLPRRVNEVPLTPASSTVLHTQDEKFDNVSHEIPQAHSNPDVESISTISGASKFSDHPAVQYKAKEVPLALASSPILHKKVAKFDKILAEIPKAHSNVSVESIIAVPLDLSGKVSKIKRVLLPVIQTTLLDADEETDNVTLDLSKKTQELTETDVIVDLSKKPATHDVESAPSVFHEEITDLSCTKVIHLNTPTDLSIRGKQQATASNDVVDYVKIMKFSNNFVPLRQSEVVTEAMSTPENETSMAVDIKTKIAERSSPRNERGSEQIKALTSRKELANDLSRKPTGPTIATSNDRQIMSPPTPSDYGSTVTAVIDSIPPTKNNSDSTVFAVNDLAMSKHGLAVKHINHNRSNQVSYDSDNNNRALLQEPNSSGSKKIFDLKIAQQKDSKQLQLNHHKEVKEISKPNSSNSNKIREPSTSKEVMEKQKMEIQSCISTDNDLNAKSVLTTAENSNELKGSLDKNFACNLQKPKYDPTLKIPQYKIRITSSNTSSSDVLNYTPYACTQKSVTPLANDSHNRLAENMAVSRPNLLQESTVLTSPYTPGDRSLYGFANGPLNTLESLPAYTMHNRSLGLPSTRHESTKPVYTLANACISVTKIDQSNSATLTNTLLSIPGSTIASTMPVYTLTDTTIGAQMDYSSVLGQGPQVNFDTVQTYTGNNSIVSRDMIAMSNQGKSINAIAAGKECRENVEIAAESKPGSISNATDPETARKIAMLPKELVDILGKMPIDHRNQLLNVLPQYVSTLTTKINDAADTVTSVTKRALSPIQAECSGKSETHMIPASRDRKPSTFYEHPSSLVSYQNSLSNVEYSKDLLEKTEIPFKFNMKDTNADKIIDLTEDDSLHSSPDSFKPIEDLSRNIFNSTPQQNIDQEGIKVTQKVSNDKTSSLRAVRIKPQIERNKSMSSIIQPTKIDMPVPCVAESNETIEISDSTSFSILAIQQAEVTSTQHKNNLKTNNETLNITPPPTTPSPDPNDVSRLRDERKNNDSTHLENTSNCDKDADKLVNLSTTIVIPGTQNHVFEHKNVSLEIGKEAVKLSKPQNIIVTNTDEEDSDDDVSLAVIVKQKRDKQTDLKTDSLKNKSTGKAGKKKKEKKIDNTSSLLDKPDQTFGKNNIDETDEEKLPDFNKDPKLINVYENVKEDDDQKNKKKKTRRIVAASPNNSETLQNQKSVRNELEINKENKDCEGQQNCLSYEIYVSNDSKKDNQCDQECKKAILRAENDKNYNECLDGQKKEINREDITPKDISDTISENCTSPIDTKNIKFNTKIESVPTCTPEKQNEICIENNQDDKSVSEVTNKQQTEFQKINPVLDFSNTNKMSTDFNTGETNATTNIDRSNDHQALPSEDTSEIQLSVYIPLRRSRRGKSMIDLIPYQDEDSSNTEIEQNIPIPKKQLIFTKIMQDEENFIKKTSPQAKISSKNDISNESPASPLIQETHCFLNDPQKQHIETFKKTKPAKRKQSPQVKRKPKKKKSTESSFDSQDERVDNLTGVDLEARPVSTLTCKDNVNKSKESDVAIMDTSHGDSSFLNSAETSLDCDSRLSNKSSNTSSAEKRKISENPTKIPTTQTSQPKKCKFSEKIESVETNVGDYKCKLNDSEISAVPENRTACYNMPVAIRRTRSKSAAVNISSEHYDPYDIDQDEMIDIGEPTKCIHQSNRNTKIKSQELSKKKHFKRMKKSESPSPENDVQDSDDMNPLAITNSNLDTPMSKFVKDHEVESDDSSKSDVPLKQLLKEKEDRLLAIHKNNEDAKIENSVEKQCEDKTNHNKSLSANNDNEIKQHETDEQLRSEQFMESFGFFSERKPRKSNLLASKKISETFHLIANETDDVYFGLKEKAIKKSLNENLKKCSEVGVNSKCVNILPKKAAKRGRKKKSITKPPTCYCCTCKKEFRRPDNYLRHQMTLLHVSKLSEIELKLETVPVAEEPNYLIAFKQQIDKLKVLTNKISRDPKSLKSRHKIVMPTLDKILADVNKTVRDQQLSKRGLSNDEALFLDCCELLKESHNPDYASHDPACPASTSNHNTSESHSAAHPAFSNLDMLGKSFPKHKVCDTKSDGDVDSITAKTILESEEVRNLENDLISGLKEAASSSHNYHSEVVETRTPDGNTDVFSSPNERDSHFDLNESDDNDNATPNNDEFNDYPVYKEKMYPDIEEIDMFEDKFDKIKRKCRSQAAAANKNQVTVEPSARVKSRRKSKSEKKKAKKNSKKIHKSMVLTKAALKGFDGIKVSIPTSDINMSAIVPAESAGKKKKSGSKKKRNKFSSESSCKLDNDERNKSTSSNQAQNLDVYEFMDNEDAELFELRPSTLMERFKREKDTPSTSTAHTKSPRSDKEKDASKHTDQDKHKDKDRTKKDKDTDKDKKDKGAEKDKKNKDTDKTKKDKGNDKDKKDKDATDKDKAENSSDDNDDFVYMSDDYRGSDHETENSQMSSETVSGKVSNETKKTSSASKRKDSAEKNVVMGKIFKNNAVRSDKKSPKAKETAKQKANLDQLFDSLLKEEPSTSSANTAKQTSKVEEENPDEIVDSIQDDIKSLSSDDLSSSSDSPHHLDKPSTSKLYRSAASSERINATRIGEPVPFDIYGPSTSKAYDEFLYGSSTSKQFDILPSKDYKSKYDLSKNSAKDESGSSPEYKVSSSSEDSDSPKQKKKQKISKERSNRVNDGASTSFDLDSVLDPGVPRQRERRKCTVGKQNVLAETWSSESEPDGVPRRPRSAESVLSGIARKKKGKKKEGHHGRRGRNKKHDSERRNARSRSPSGGYEEGSMGNLSSVRTSGGCPAPASAVPPIVPVAGPSGVARSIVPVAGPSGVARSILPVAGPSGVSRPIVPVAGPSGVSRQNIVAVAGSSGPVAGPSGVIRPRARAASFWTSEGEEHVQQHGWIVGDSHKKLVTMLAHAKGRKRNNDDKRNVE